MAIQLDPPEPISRGVETSVTIDIDPNSSAEIVIRDPNGAEMTLQVSSDDSGSATGTFTLPESWGLVATFEWPLNEIEDFVVT